MANYRKAQESNAIEEVVFVLVFEEEFDSDTVGLLVNQLPNLLVNDFPYSTQSNKVSFNVDSGVGAMGLPESTLAGITLRDSSDANNAGWVMRADANSVAVSCRRYTRWIEVGQKVQRTFSALLNLVDFTNNKLLEIGFQCTDRFFEDDIDEYSVGNVLDVDSKYLTQNVFEAGKMWHVYQGWFETSEHSERMLNVLNISSQLGMFSDTGIEGQSTNIQHAAKLQLLSSTLTCEQLLQKEDGVTLLQSIYGDMHTKNKDVLKNLLNKDVISDIGL